MIRISQRSSRCCNIPWRFSTLTDELNPKIISLRMGRAELPHPEKLFRGGEDASFASERLNAMGLADGVGGWLSQGVNPGVFARALMRYVEDELDPLYWTQIGRLHSGKDTEPPSTLIVLRRAYDRVIATNLLGSCTAVVAYVSGRILHVANLGDSGLVVLRPLNGEVVKKKSGVPSKYSIVFRTTEQQHSFNFPLQLGSDQSDLPEAADIAAIQLVEGDVIIGATDGVLDNLFDDDIKRIIESGSTDSHELAYEIASRAQEIAIHSKGRKATPFAVNASKIGRDFRGGKLDDISVIVARAVESGVQFQ